MNTQNQLTHRIIEAFYKVYNTLGYGFLEKVYEKAMYYELSRSGIYVNAQVPVTVYYEDTEVGNYWADLIVEQQVIVEIKAAAELRCEHEFQLINYLRATEIELGLLLNFGKRPQISRKIYSH